MYVTATFTNTTTHQLQAGLQHSPQLLLARSRYKPCADLRWPGSWDASPSSINPGSPEVANICPLSFRCTRGVYGSHMDAEDGCGGESRSPAHTASPLGYPSTVSSELDKWNKSQSFGPLSRSCKSIPEVVPFTSLLPHGISKRTKKWGIFAFSWDALGSF